MMLSQFLIDIFLWLYYNKSLISYISSVKIINYFYMTFKVFIVKVNKIFLGNE